MSVKPSLSVRVFLFAMLCAFLTFPAIPITPFCADPVSRPLENPVTKSTLPAVIGTWKTKGAPRVLTGKECESLQYGEIGMEYGVETVTIANYVNGKESYIVESFAMRFPSSAYGFFTFLQAKGDIGQRQLWAGRQLIRIRNEKGSTPDNAEFFEGLKKLTGDQSPTLPPLSKHLPKTNKLAEGEIYIIGPKALAQHPHFGFLKEAVNFEGGTEAITAEYQQPEAPLGLLLLEFHTPQLATDGHTKLETFRTALSEPAFSQTKIKRVGNYVAIANAVKDNKIVDQILGEIKYTAVVHWEGKKYSAIPLEYRPPDAAALEEASETALVLLRTFYWIGLMLALAAIFGIAAGSGFFYWRRYQRKKAGFDDLFSDAGGTIRLNLEDDTDGSERKLLN